MGNWYIRYAIWSNSLLLLNLWEFFTLDNRKMNKNLTQSQPRNDKSYIPFHVTFSRFRMSMKLAVNNRNMNKYLTQSHSKCHMWDMTFPNVNAFLVPIVWEVCTVNNMKMNKCLTKSHSQIDMSFNCCHFTLFSRQRLRSLRNKEKEEDRILDSLNQNMVHRACLFKVLLFTAQCIRSLHCTVNNKKKKLYLTESHWETDISDTPFEVTHT